jgi:hypothetical protein
MAIHMVVVRIIERASREIKLPWQVYQNQLRIIAELKIPGCQVALMTLGLLQYTY